MNARQVKAGKKLPAREIASRKRLVIKLFNSVAAGARAVGVSTPMMWMWINGTRTSANIDAAIAEKQAEAATEKAAA